MHEELVRHRSLFEQQIAVGDLHLADPAHQLRQIVVVQLAEERELTEPFDVHAGMQPQTASDQRTTNPVRARMSYASSASRYTLYRPGGRGHGPSASRVERARPLDRRARVEPREVGVDVRIRAAFVHPHPVPPVAGSVPPAHQDRVADPVHLSRRRHAAGRHPPLRPRSASATGRTRRPSGRRRTSPGPSHRSRSSTVPSISPGTGRSADRIRRVAGAEDRRCVGPARRGRGTSASGRSPPRRAASRRRRTWASRRPPRRARTRWRDDRCPTDRRRS